MASERRREEHEAVDVRLACRTLVEGTRLVLRQGLQVVYKRRMHITGASEGNVRWLR